MSDMLVKRQQKVIKKLMKIRSENDLNPIVRAKVRESIDLLSNNIIEMSV